LECEITSSSRATYLTRFDPTETRPEIFRAILKDGMVNQLQGVAGDPRRSGAQ